MKLMLNIVRKDFWRLRGLLAVWLAIVALRLGLGFWTIAGGGGSGLPFEQALSIAYGLMALGLLLTWALTAMLVLEDTLVGAEQFWVTRPISGARLLAGKTFGWLLLLWLPAVVLSLPWWITCGFGPVEIFWAAIELLAWQVAVALPAALVAAVTDNMSRFLVWSFVVVFAATLIPGLAERISDARIIHNASDSVLLIFVFWTAAGFFTAWVVVRQYLRRDLQRWRLLGWAASGLVLAVIVGGVAGGLQGWARHVGAKWTDWHAERAGGVSLALHSFWSEGGKKRLDDVRLHSLLEVRGLPNDLVLDSGDGARQTWSWPDAPTVTRGDLESTLWVNVRNDWRSVRAALGGVAPEKPDGETERHLAEWRAAHAVKTSQGFRPEKMPPVSVELSADVLGPTFTRIKQAPPAYAATVRLRLLMPELWAEVPLQAGAWHAHAAHGFRVGGLTPIDPEGPADAPSSSATTRYAPLVATMPGFFWDNQVWRSWWFSEWRGAGLFVVNRAAGNVERQLVRRGPEIAINSVNIQLSTLRVWQPVVRRGDKWVLRDPNWLAGVTVAMMGFRDEARFTAEVKAERYEAAK